ncbi:MAG: hypothetical protein AAFR38_00060 [Planctomycetota bacterium]
MLLDPGGIIAAAFGVSQSGRCLAFNAVGGLLFSGGVGDASAADAMTRALLEGRAADPGDQDAPTGCALVRPGDTPETASAACG